MRWIGRGRCAGVRTDVDASTSVVRGRFDDRDFLSVRGGATSSSRTAAATSNEDNVVLIGKLDWSHLGRVKCSGDLFWCVSEETGKGKKGKKKTWESL